MDKSGLVVLITTQYPTTNKGLVNIIPSQEEEDVAKRHCRVTTSTCQHRGDK